MLSRFLPVRSACASVWSAWVLTLTACSTPLPSSTSRAQLPIVYAEPSPAGTSDDAVLLLRTTIDGQELVCSASLVAKNVVLTARHCVAHSIQGPFNCTVRGELVDNPDGAGQIGLDLPADTLEFYGGATPRNTPLARGTTIFSTLSSTICVNDLALVVLDRQVDLPVLPLRLRGRARTGEAVVVVGYGFDETQSIIDVRTQARHRKTGLTISGVGPDSVDQGVTTVAPRTIVVDGPSECEGDSGGPLRDATSGAIVGVYSSLDGLSCVDSRVRHVFVHVPPLRAVIDDAFRAAGATPMLEPKLELDAASDADADVADDGGSSTPSAPGVPDDGCSVTPPRARDPGGSRSSGALLASFLMVGTARRKVRAAARRRLSATTLQRIVARGARG